MRIRLKSTYENFSILEEAAFFLYFLIEVNIELFAYRPLYIFSVVFLTFALLFSGKAAIRITKYTVWTACWAILVAFSLSYTISKSSTTLALLTILARALVFFAIGARVRNERLLENMLKILVAVEFFNILYILSRINILSGIQRIGKLSIESDSDNTWNSNGIASDLALCIMCLLALIRNNAVKHRIVAYLLVILFVPVGILCGSRMGLLLIVGPPLLWVFLTADRKTVVWKYGAIILAAVAAYFIVFKIPVVYNILGVRVERLLFRLQGRDVLDKSINERSSLVAYGLTWFRQRPIFGYGMFSFRAMIAGVLNGRSIYAHNNYVETLFGTGIVGFVCYYWLYAYLLFKSFNNRKRYRHWAIVTAGIIVIIIAEFATVSFKKFAFQFAVFLLFLVMTFDYQEYFAGSKQKPAPAGGSNSP